MYGPAIDTPTLATTRPHGRTEVIDALVGAATELFAERGPAVVSLRDVARAANVNLGLIHRYIGGKQDLLAEVLARRPGMPALDEVIHRSPEEIVDLLLDLMAADAAYMRVMLRASLDGFDVTDVQATLPVLERAAASARAHLPRRDADVRVALLSAIAMAWQATGPLMLGVLDQQDLSPGEVLDTLRPGLLAFLTAAPSASP